MERETFTLIVHATIELECKATSEEAARALAEEYVFGRDILIDELYEDDDGNTVILPSALIAYDTSDDD